MTHKTRLEKLEKKIIPKKKTEVGHFMTSDYLTKAEMDQAINKWIKSLPEGVEGIVIEHVLSVESDEEDQPKTKYKGQENDHE